MFLPELNETSKTRDFNIEFRGYNHNLYLDSTQFYNMENMTGVNYPVIVSRGKRAKLRKLDAPNGLYAKEALAWVDGQDFYYDGEVVGRVEDGPKQMVGMGAWVLIWPDCAYYNTYTREFGSLSDEYAASGTVTYTLARVDGSDYGNYEVSDTPPLEPVDGQLWVDTSGAVDVLKQYSAQSGVWTQILSVFVKIQAAGIDEHFALYDGVSISGCVIAELNGSSIIYGIGTDYIIITGIIEQTTTQTGGLAVSRDIPQMDYIVENNNRLWGCSSANREVYACKLGDPKNWNSFQGIASDSYAATVGSDGQFTGAYSLGGRVYFFKEDIVHVIYGDKPSNFTVKESRTQGVEAGSSASIALVGGGLMYKGRSGICAFDGESAVTISRDLGTGKYAEAVGGALGQRYYVSMRDESGAVSLFVFDESLSMWHREDSTRFAWAVSFMGELYFINADDGCLYAQMGSLNRYADEGFAAKEARVPWMVETGDIGVTMMDNKYVSKIQLRVSVGEGATFSAFVKYDSSGQWMEKFTLSPACNRIHTIPITPVRCDHMRIMMRGEGLVRLYSISKIIEQGSEL